MTHALSEMVRLYENVLHGMSEIETLLHGTVQDPEEVKVTAAKLVLYKASRFVQAECSGVEWSGVDRVEWRCLTSGSGAIGWRSHSQQWGAQRRL